MSALASVPGEPPEKLKCFSGDLALGDVGTGKVSFQVLACPSHE